MKLFQICFWAGLISVPLSIGMWFLAPDLSGVAFDGIVDPVLREALKGAHSERWGIFVGLWPPTLLVLSLILSKDR